MEPINNLQESDSDDSSTLSLRDLPLHGNDEPSQTHNSSSPPQDLFDFSFPLPPATEKNNSSMSDVFLHGHYLPNNFAPTPKLPPFVHRRAESMEGNDGEAHAVDYRRLRRACSDPRPTPAEGRWRRWPFYALGSLKLPTELEMGVMRSRQRQRGPPEVVAGCGRRSCWSILRALSCKAAESTSVAPLGVTDRAPVASTCTGIFGRSQHDYLVSYRSPSHRKARQVGILSSRKAVHCHERSTPSDLLPVWKPHRKCSSTNPCQEKCPSIEPPRSACEAFLRFRHAPCSKLTSPKKILSVQRIHNMDSALS